MYVIILCCEYLGFNLLVVLIYKEDRFLDNFFFIVLLLEIVYFVILFILVIVFS